MSSIIYFSGPQLGPDRNSGSSPGSVGIWAGTGSGSVPVDLTGTRPVPAKVAKRTVKNRYNSLKSENLKMLLFMKYNLRFLNFRY